MTTQLSAEATPAIHTPLLRRLPAFPPWGAALIGALLVAVVIAVSNDAFLTPRNLSNIFAQTAVLVILATGQTFVMITAGIDLSVAAVGALSATLLGVLTVANDLPWSLSLLICLLAGAAIGVLHGVLVGRVLLPAFIVTLGGLLVWRGVALQLTGGINTTGLPDPIRWLGRGLIAGVPVPAVIAVLVAAISAIVIVKTKFGVGLRAIGGSEGAAARAGVPVLRYRITAYIICSMLACLGGIMLAGRLDSAGGNLAQGFELQVIAAAAIGGVSLFGGTGSPVGAFFGAILIGLIQNGMNLGGVSPFIQQIVSGAILVLAVGVDQFRKYLARRIS
ncbi:ABC transporter permease [Dactylosporangium sp. NPDC051485]|uniref:ABC transporter permease n=1 Tax=Dactylosporangium sp. NPDC051485 TaxID=3154846 RepID=UPI0034418427